MKVEFTPGPWLFSSYKSGNSVIVIDGKEFDVATVNYPNRDANAHLIAAAPELYEALENILSEMHIDDYGDWALNTSFDVESIHAVLAKARGEK